jgi:hypothetical protein
MRSGNYHRALALLHNVEAPGCALMRARAWFRLGRHDRAAAECTRRDPSCYDAHEAIQLLELLAASLADQNEIARAYDILEAAKQLAACSGNPLLAAHAAKSEAIVAFVAEDFPGSRAALAYALEALAGLAYVKPQKDYHVEPIVLRAKLHDLEGWHHALRGDLAAQEECLLASVAGAADPRNPDRITEGRLLSNLASYVYRRPSLPGHAYLLARAATFPWSAHTDVVETRIRCALENSHRLFGYGQGPANIGGRSAPSLSLRLTDCVTALLLDTWQSRERFIEECRFSVSMAFEINAAENSGTEVLDILQLACTIAPFDVTLARRVRDMFAARRAAVSKFHLVMHAPSVAAQLHFADGCIAKAGGNLREAMEQFGASLESAPVGYGDYLGAIVGLERYSVTRRQPDLSRARAFVATFPKSAFTARLREALAGAEYCGPGDFPYLGLYGVAGIGRGRGSAAAALTPHIRADRTA